MEATLFVMLLLIGAAVITAGVLQRSWDLNSIFQVPREGLARLLPLPSASQATLRRRFARALTSQRIVMPSGRTKAASILVVRLATDDVRRLATTGNLDELAADGELLYQRHAHEKSWEIAGPTRVLIRIDPALQPGWVPPARVAATPLIDPDGDSSGSTPSRAAREGEYLGGRTQPLEETHPTGTTVFSGGTTVLNDQVALLRNPTTGQTHTLSPQGTVVGRERGGCDLPIDEAGVSRRHAWLGVQGGAWVLTDLGATNGTRVDGERVPANETRPLRHGALVQFSRGTEFRFEIPAI